MPIWAPPVPNRDVFPTELAHTATTISVRFRRNYFSDGNGQVVAYAVIVAEDYTKPTENKLTLPKWQDVQQFRTWPPYQVRFLFSLSLKSNTNLTLINRLSDYKGMNILY